MNEAEQKQIREQQDETIKKVLGSQKELSTELVALLQTATPLLCRDGMFCFRFSVKKEILSEHDRNMTSLQNQLQMSKLRQQKL